jgi:hypothetical protein
MLNIIKTLLISMLLIMTVPAFAFADNHENETVEITTTDIKIENTRIEKEPRDMREHRELGYFEDEDERNAYITKTPLGAKIRVLQLKDSLIHQARAGNLIIEYLNNKNTSTEDLVTITAKFEGLIEEIDSMSIENKTAEELAKEFVAIKEEAKNLSSQFKETVSSSLSEEEKQELREILKKDKEENKEKNEKLRELVKEHNLEKTKEVLNRLGVDPTEIAEQLRSGNISLDDIKERIRNKFENHDIEKRENFKTEFREESQKIRIEAKERKDDLKEETRIKVENLRERLEERKEDLMELRMKNEELRTEMRMKNEEMRAEMKIKEGEIEAKFREGDTRFEIRKDGEQRFRDENREVRVRSDRTIEIKDKTDDDLEEEKETEEEERN